MTVHREAPRLPARLLENCHLLRAPETDRMTQRYREELPTPATLRHYDVGGPPGAGLSRSVERA